MYFKDTQFSALRFSQFNSIIYSIIFIYKIFLLNVNLRCLKFFYKYTFYHIIFIPIRN